MSQISSICIIIPCFNEASRLPVEDFKEFLQDNQNRLVCLFFVNDGSTDGTLNVLNDLHSRFLSQTTIINLLHNKGKAEAVRVGINTALADSRRFEWIGYFDADLATPLSAIRDLYNAVNQANYQFVLGSRVLILGHRIERVWYRHYFGRIFATFASILLKLPVYDTQCGAKLIHRSICKSLFDEPFISAWFFDVELLARVIKYYGRDFVAKHLLEYPLYEWVEKHESKIKISDITKIPLEFLKIYKHYKSSL